MAHHNTGSNSLSESIEMYVLRVALLQHDDQPVPIPELSQELDITPVSANEMCRKLTERGLLTYEPYRGVTLTANGNRLARRILRYRRLWEVFFVERLGIDPLEAEEIACRFEHVTPHSLAERLAAYLENPSLSPQNQPIPASNGQPRSHSARPLTNLATGARGRVVSITGAKLTKDFLRAQGISPGMTVEVLSVVEDRTCLVETCGQHISLSSSLARQIDVVSIEDSNLTEAIDETRC